MNIKIWDIGKIDFELDLSNLIISQCWNESLNCDSKKNRHLLAQIKNGKKIPKKKKSEANIVLSCPGALLSIISKHKKVYFLTLTFSLISPWNKWHVTGDRWHTTCDTWPLIVLISFKYFWLIFTHWVPFCAANLIKLDEMTENTFTTNSIQDDRGHFPHPWRVNVVLSNTPQFAKVKIDLYCNHQYLYRTSRDIVEIYTNTETFWRKKI